MLRVTLSEADRKVLAEERFVHPHPRVQQRMWVVWLKDRGFAHQDIARAMGVTDDTVTSYLTSYVDHGLDGLRAITFHRPESELKAHQTTLEAYFREHPPATVAEARAAVKRLTGIERSPTQVGVFLRRMGMRCRKVAAVPAKVDLDAQEAFKKTTWSPA
jgi:transposase